MKKLPFYQDAYDQGVQAFRNGAKTIEEAKALRPYKLFGDRTEHAKGVAWGKGWNSEFVKGKR